MRNTKIVATLGPSSESPEIVTGLLEAGVDVFRLNASHGNHQEHAARVATVRALAKQMGVHPALLLDLQGPKIRLGEFEGGKCRLAEGTTFTLTTEIVMGNTERATTGYPELVRDVKPGDRVLLADGSVHMQVLSTSSTEAHCQVVVGGEVGSRKGINLPGVSVSSPSMTKKDIADLRWGLEMGIDMVALSFVRTRMDVLRLRLYLEDHDARLPVIAKIEKPEGWTNLDQILAESDGVMVARGDLGVEMALEKVPFIQKSIIERARTSGKFVITATQMLESMIENATPTRAEVSDVANAIYDGTDAVMLSAETSAGKFPVEAAAMMARIAQEAETSTSCRPVEASADHSQPEILADAAFRAARRAGATAIVVFTATGATARLVARYRPSVPIYAFTSSLAVSRQLAVSYGVRAVEAPTLGSTDEMMAQMDRLLLERNCVRTSDMVVFLAGQPIGRPGTTNMLKLHRIGELR